MTKEQIKISFVEWFIGNKAQIISIIFLTAVLLYAYGCESKTPSLKQAGKRVNRVELMLELETVLSESRIRISDLDRQDQFKQILFQQAFIIAEGGSLSIPGLVTTLLAVFGTGAIVDNRRKAKVIKDARKNNA